MFTRLWWVLLLYTLHYGSLHTNMYSNISSYFSPLTCYNCTFDSYERRTQTPQYLRSSISIFANAILCFGIPNSIQRYQKNFFVKTPKLDTIKILPLEETLRLSQNHLSWSVPISTLTDTSMSLPICPRTSNYSHLSSLACLLKLAKALLQWSASHTKSDLILFLVRSNLHF